VPIGAVTITPGTDANSFTVSGGEAGHASGAFLALPPGRCDYVASVEGRLVGDTKGWDLAVRSVPSGGFQHSLSYVRDLGVHDSGDAFTEGPVDVHRATDLGWHRLTVEMKGDLHTTWVDGEAVAQGQEFIENEGPVPVKVSNDCGGVSLSLYSPGTVEFRNFALSDPPEPFVQGHPCPKLHPATAYPLLLCDEGPLVRDLQTALDIRVRTTVDGQFGLGTLAALQELQVRAGLPVSGILDPATAAVLGLPFNT
jgi:hypothetical protein